MIHPSSTALSLLGVGWRLEPIPVVFRQEVGYAPPPPSHDQGHMEDKTDVQTGRQHKLVNSSGQPDALFWTAGGRNLESPERETPHADTGTTRVQSSTREGPYVSFLRQQRESLNGAIFLWGVHLIPAVISPGWNKGMSAILGNPCPNT